MNPLAARLAFLLREWGIDPSARQGELQALSAMEERDQRPAVERFHELKRGYALQRRGDLLVELRRHDFVLDVPEDDARGMTQREIERDIKWGLAAVLRAREIAAAEEETRAHLATLSARRVDALPELGAAPWSELSALAARAEARRRVAAREARIESRIGDARRRAGRLKRRRVEVPDLSSDARPDPDDAAAILDALEARLAAEEALEDAHRAALAPLRDPAVRTRRARSMAELEKEADIRLAESNLEGLRAVLVRAEALRAEAAREASAATRARKAGKTAPRGENRAGDTIDGYG